MRNKNKNIYLILSPISAAVALAFSGQAHALSFQTDNGWDGQWNTTLSIGSQWRAEGQDKALYSAANGALAGKSGGLGDKVDSGNLNYDKGDRFSTIGKFVTDLSLRNGDMGGVIRVKGWYDYTLEQEDVNFGSVSNGYRKRPLNDDGLEDLQKYQGLYLLDAYIYNTFNFEQTPVQVRLGRQVINWGESVFIQGVNQVNPLDVPALRRPGTELKEALIPVWMAYMNIGLPDGMSVETFYQLKYENTPIEGCGNYWSQTEGAIGSKQGDCNVAGVIIPGITSAESINAGGYIPTYKGKDPSDGGQWGVAFHMPIDAVDGELGLYYLNYHSRTPFIGVSAGHPTPLAAFPNAAPPLFGGLGTTWEYPENIHLFGLSFSTVIDTWSVGAELSYSPNQPVQQNGADLLLGVLSGAGPLGGLQQQLLTGQNPQSFYASWDRFEQTQLLLNGINQYPNVLGAETLTIIGEVGFQWNNVPQGASDPRYGRGFVYGVGSDSSLGSTCSGSGGPVSNTSPGGCKNKGYVTDYAWGYRLRAQLDYSNVMNSGVGVSPYIFVSQDVDGVSPDGQFNEGRIVTSLGATFNYDKKHKVDLSYVRFADSAVYDPLHDRDYYAASYSFSF
ncbi:DUF1302 domain-containing protein [Pseudomonas sp. ANT_J28]|uniref:DUF1302 domain-containing protein n=1 Tax=Pseudomonas sp. ANT_J28 TaxID=2597352 RepID=UPI0011F14379|nr:DUF1302 domain-containing protein [Pseudomonas sp. ANT_J28]KAA0973526.1 DUF1302 domain-containing protein [Pseudomonas sp. ANT_J28]